MARKNTVVPVNQESEFSPQELFFSTTDPIGNILTGNDVFVRVSQYAKADLIGSPHNIIRHPDMPKIVFKTLWDYLKAKKIIIAYVKNMTKEGKYYWVLACVFPVPQGYLSIRIKPSSDIFRLIPDLYRDLLTAQEAHGMSASLELLLKSLQIKGFKDYDAFMAKVILEELKSRQRLLPQQRDRAALFLHATVSKQQEVFNAVSGHCQTINQAFNRLFSEFDCLLTIEKTTDETTAMVIKFSDQISILALNSSIETYRLGSLGSTLSVISKAIKRYSEEIEFYASSIVKYSKEISSHAQQLGLLVSTSKLQADMIDFFATELLEQSKRRVIPDEELKEMRGNMNLLIENFSQEYVQASNLLKPLTDNIRETAELINFINHIINNLERSDVLGCIEASRLAEQGQKFLIVFKQMQESTEHTTTSLVEFDKYLKRVFATLLNIHQANVEILKGLEDVKLAIRPMDAMIASDAVPVGSTL